MTLCPSPPLALPHLFGNGMEREMDGDKRSTLLQIRRGGVFALRAIRSAPGHLREYREVVLEAVKQDGFALQYAGGGLKKSASGGGRKSAAARTPSKESSASKDAGGGGDSAGAVEDPFGGAFSKKKKELVACVVAGAQRRPS